MNIATGVFKSVNQAESAVRALRDAGIRDHDISLVTRQRDTGMTLAKNLDRKYRGDDAPPTEPIVKDIYSRYSSDYADDIRRSDLPPDALDWYTQRLDAGEILVIVDVGDRMDDVDHIIHDNGGMLYRDRDRMGRQAATTGATGPMGTAGTQAFEEIRLPIIEEQVNVQRMTHQIGEIEVRQETTSQTVDVPTTIVHNQIRVERHKLDRPIHPDEYKTMTTQQGTIRMPIIDEEVRVFKEPVIREEIVIRRVPVSERGTARETITRTEPRVETHGDVRIERPGEERPAA